MVTEQTVSEAFDGAVAILHPVWKGFSDLSAEEAVAEVRKAKAAYSEVLGGKLGPVAPAAHADIEGAFDIAADACLAGDFEEFRRQRQVILKSFLHGCYVGAKAGLAAGDVAAATPWLQHIRTAGKWDERRNPAAEMVERIVTGSAGPSDVEDVLDAILVWFAGQVKHMAVEAQVYLKKENRPQVLIEAVEAQVYLRPIQQDLAARLGDEVVGDLKQTIDDLRAEGENGSDERVGSLIQRIQDLIPYQRGAASSR